MSRAGCSEGNPSSSKPGIASILANGDPLYGDALSNSHPGEEYIDRTSKRSSLNLIGFSLLDTPLKRKCSERKWGLRNILTVLVSKWIRYFIIYLINTTMRHLPQLAYDIFFGIHSKFIGICLASSAGNDSCWYCPNCLLERLRCCESKWNIYFSITLGDNDS